MSSRDTNEIATLVKLFLFLVDSCGKHRRKKTTEISFIWKMEADGNKAESRERERDERNQQVGDGSRQTGSRASTLEMLGQDKQTGTQHIANRFRRAAAGRRTIPSLSRQTGRCQLGGCTAIKDRLAIWMRRMDERCGGEKVGKPNAPGRKGGEADRVFASPTRFCPNRGERATLLKRQ